MHQRSIFSSCSRLVPRTQGSHSQPSRSPATLPPNAGEQRLKAFALRHKPNVYRVIYRVVEAQKEVDILHIRHGASNHSRPTILSDLESSSSDAAPVTGKAKFVGIV